MDIGSYWERFGGLIVWGLIIWAAFAFFGDNEQNSVTNEKSYNAVNFEPVQHVEPPTYNSYSVPQNLHYDDDFKYNYRTGYSGDYDYNYDVEGYGDTGYAYGNIDVSGKYGDGYLYTEDGEEVYIQTEWIDYGVMEAYDENGNWYELEVY